MNRLILVCWFLQRTRIARQVAASRNDWFYTCAWRKTFPTVMILDVWHITNVNVLCSQRRALGERGDQSIANIPVIICTDCGFATDCSWRQIKQFTSVMIDSLILFEWARETVRFRLSPLRPIHCLTSEDHLIRVQYGHRECMQYLWWYVEGQCDIVHTTHKVSSTSHYVPVTTLMALSLAHTCVVYLLWNNLEIALEERVPSEMIHRSLPTTTRLYKEQLACSHLSYCKQGRSRAWAQSHVL